MLVHQKDIINNKVNCKYIGEFNEKFKGNWMVKGKWFLMESFVSDKFKIGNSNW